jgi:hypothetical protein
MERSELARGEQPRQLGVDAGEALLGVGGGMAGGAAEGRRGGGARWASWAAAKSSLW